MYIMKKFSEKTPNLKNSKSVGQGEKKNAKKKVKKSGSKNPNSKGLM